MGRATVLVFPLLALWWFLLKPASLWLLRVAAYFPLALLITPGGYDPVHIDPATGGWVFNVAVNAAGKDAATGRSQMIDSLEFVLAEGNIAHFAASWFLYIALALSVASRSKAYLKQVSLGLTVQTAISILALAAYVYTNALGTVLSGTPDFRLWFAKYVYYIVNLVVPFAGPFAVALLVHPEWRNYCASFAFPGTVRSTGASPAASKPRGK